MEVAGLAFLIAAFVVGFLIAGRWFNNVVLQLIVGAAMGIALIAALVFGFLGIMFAGCLITGGTMDFK